MNKDLTLCIETATANGSLALLRGADVCAVWRGDESFAHSSGLLGEINNLFVESRTALEQIGEIVVAIGPGSFTGLRVGLATAKGLAAALRATLVGVPTLAAMCVAAQKQQRIAAIISAGRDNVFAQTFQIDAQNQLEPQTALAAGTLPNVLTQLNSPQAIVAPIELQQQIKVAFDAQNQSAVELLPMPTNLAICVGRAAKHGRVAATDNFGLIYGRGADARKPNR